MQPSGVKVILQFGEGEDAGVPWWRQEMESQRGVCECPPSAAPTNNRGHRPHTSLPTHAQRICRQEAGRNYFNFIFNRR